MDAAYLPAFAALAGSTIGGLTSLATSWLTQHVQFRRQQRVHDLRRRQELYKDFIEEASKLYVDAFEHDDAETSKLVHLYAMISLMRVGSSPRVVASADDVARTIVDTYLGPNRTFRDVRAMLDDATLNPLREFSEACREELREESSLGDAWTSRTSARGREPVPPRATRGPER